MLKRHHHDSGSPLNETTVEIRRHDARAQLPARSLLIMMVSVVLVLFAVCAFILYNDYTNRLKAARSQTTNNAIAQGDHVRLVMNSVDSIVQATAREMETHPPQAVASELLADVGSRLPLLRTLMLVDPDGVIIAEARPEMGAVGLDVSDRGYFRIHQTLHYPDLYIGEPVQSRVDDAWSMPMSLAVRDENGVLMCVVVASIEPRFFTNELHGLHDHTGFTATRDGRVLMTTPHDDAHINRSLAETHLFTRELVTQTHGTYHGAAPLTGEDAIIAYQLLDEFPLVVGAYLSRGDILSSFYVDSAVTVGVTLLAIIGVVALTRFQMRQTQRIVDQAAALSEEVRERARAIRSLRESEHRFHILFDLAPAAITLTDRERGQFIAVNDQFTLLLGYTLPEILQMQAAELYVDPQTRPQLMQQLADTGIVRDAETIFRRKDGSHTWILISMQLVSIQGEERILSVFTDISQRKATEDALRESEQKYRQLFEGALHPITIYDENATILMLNGRNPDGSTVDPTPFIGRPLRDIVPDKHDITIERIRQIMSTGEPLYFEEKITLPGAEYWFWTSMQPIRNTAGKIHAVQAISYDISERKQLEEMQQRIKADLETRVAERTTELTVANQHLKTEMKHRKETERALVAAHKRLKTILDTSPVPILVVRADDNSGDGLYANPAFYRFSTGEPTTPEIIHLPLANCPLTPHIPELLAEMAESDKLSDRELRLFRSDGSESWVLLSGQRLEYDGTGAVLFTLIDISERHLAEEEMHQALEKQQELGRLKASFVSMVSHEFRTPLSVIQTSTDMLRRYRHKYTDEQWQARLDTMVAQVWRLKDYIDDIAFMNKQDFVTQRLHLAEVDLSRFIDQIIAEIGLAYQEANIKNVVLDNSCASFTTDETLLRQIVSNLLSNAVKYSSIGKPVTLTRQCADDGIQIEIIDNGIGIPESDQAHLFDLFHRASNVGDIQGTGLGLTIVKQAVAALGGTVAFTSTLGTGTRFTVWLPTIDEPENLPGHLPEVDETATSDDLSDLVQTTLARYTDGNRADDADNTETEADDEPGAEAGATAPYSDAPADWRIDRPDENSKSTPTFNAS